MSLWELSAAVDGHNRANGHDPGPPPMTGDEFDALLDKHAEFVRH